MATATTGTAGPLTVADEYWQPYGLDLMVGTPMVRGVRNGDVRNNSTAGVPVHIPARFDEPAPSPAGRHPSETTGALDPGALPQARQLLGQIVGENGHDAGETTEAGAAATRRARSRLNPELALLRDFARVVAAAGSSVAARIEFEVLGFTTAGQIEEGDASLVEAILESTLTTEVMDQISSVMGPLLEPDSLITLSLAELSRFIMFFSQEAGGFKLIDMRSGRRVSLNDPLRRTGSQTLTSQQGRPSAAAAGTETFTLSQFMAIVRNLISTYVLHPLTLFALVLGGLIWLVLRLRSREA